MKVLIIKTSSLGDVIHTLPALTDAAKAIKNISFDWVVEDSFQDIPRLHPNVERVIPVAIRRWRKNPWAARAEIRASITAIQQQHYDLVIDAQGLIKSAFITRFAQGKRCGLSKTSCREPLAALAYQQTVDVAKGQHAIYRVRQLFAQLLGYDIVEDELAYGLDKAHFKPALGLVKPYLVFLHGTTWDSKHWPEVYWQDLLELAVTEGFNVYLPWGNEQEKQRAEMLAQTSSSAHVLPRSSIQALTAVLMHAKGVVGVDSGLAHLTAACGTPSVSLYGSTSAKLTATMGLNNLALQTDFGCSPCLQRVCDYAEESEVQPACYQTLNAAKVWSSLKPLMSA